MRLFLDANVVFSAAHNPDGNSRALFPFASNTHDVRLISSRFAIEEATRNLALQYLTRLDDLKGLISALGTCAEPTPRAITATVSAGLPAKDAPILGGTIGARAHALVTGDRQHFGPIFGQTIDGVTVVTPAEAVILLLSRG